ncbi:MAG: type III pantothenate kinase [Dehalococcoidales bacterium]|nr:type III pantothenate kinase [Dehalococcoidales bacterium]
MLLAIDIGNTDTKLGVFEDTKLRATWHMATNIHRTADEYAAILLNLMHHQKLDTPDITETAICSVVPPLITIYEDLFQHYFKLTPLVIGAGVKTGVSIHMDNPKEVGADRVVNAAAAHHLYGGPVIVTDMGTATTFDIVSKEGCYQGGSIAPGINTAAETLFIKAAMLPRVELIHPKHAIGTSTVTAMQSGIVLGYVSLIEGMIARIQKELGEKALVVATGGWATIIAKETAAFDVINPDLTLIGIRLIYLMNRS